MSQQQSNAAQQHNNEPSPDQERDAFAAARDDIADLINEHVLKCGGDLSYASFKALWKTRYFSHIHKGCPWVLVRVLLLHVISCNFKPHRYLDIFPFPPSEYRSKQGLSLVPF